MRLGAVDESVLHPELEHCVVMRRLPQGRDAVSLVEGGEFTAGHVDAITRVIVRFMNGTGSDGPRLSPQRPG